MISSTSGGGGAETNSRKGPLDFFVSIFRKRHKDLNFTDSSEETFDESSSETDLYPTTTRERKGVVYRSRASYSDRSRPFPPPCPHRDPQRDAETLRMSRHDNPIIQRKLSSPPPPLLSVGSDEGSDDDPFWGVHEHLIRSPPPILPSSKTFTFCNSHSSSSRSPLARKHSLTESIQKAPLPHVRQSTVMFRPLSVASRETRNSRENRRQQAKDLKPLLVSQSDSFTCGASFSDLTPGSAPSSPNVPLAPTKRSGRRSRLPAFPSQKTL